MDDDDRQLRESHERLRWMNEESERMTRLLERNLKANLNVWRGILKTERQAVIPGEHELELEHD